MKVLMIMLQIAFINQTLLAKITRGGVDVGNGMVTIHHLKVLDYEIESELVQDIDDQLNEIQNGQHPEVMKAAFEGMCQTTSAEFRNLSITSYYPKSFDNLYRFGKKRYQGNISVGLKDCLVPEMISLNQENILVLGGDFDEI